MGIETKGSAAAPARIGKDEKIRLEEENRARLVEDLRTRRLVFESRPRVVEIQLSNFCNMSCTMCYDGVNPPTKKLAEPIVEKVAAALFPTASVFVPFATSEPLILTWDLTRRLAEQYGVELEITTNVQFLDEKKLAEVEPLLGSIEFSIDSHIREVYDAIRLKARSDKVFRNLPIAARYLRDRGVEVVTNVVFMTQNAPHVHDTVAFLADAGIPSVHIQKLFYNKPEATLDDPVLHFSREWIDRLKARVRKVAEAKKIKVAFDFDGYEVVDHLPKDEAFRPSRARDGWLESLRRAFPGYCPQSVYRFKVDNDGNAYPCCVGVEDRLKLGNVVDDSIEEIWNGPTSQDLRRGMLTGDVPTLCEACNFRNGPIPKEYVDLPFCSVRPYVPPERRTLEIVGPPHLTRTEAVPTIRWRRPDAEFDRYELVFSLGGDQADAVITMPPDATEFRCSDEMWNQMLTNAAYWWAIWAVADDDPSKTLRSAGVRCIIHHEPIPRVRGSTLSYSEPRPRSPDAPPPPPGAPAPPRDGMVGSLKRLAKKTLFAR